ncbi:unnamed protein product [Musa textilis]
MCSCSNKSLAKVIQIERERVLRKNPTRARLDERPYGPDSTMPGIGSLGY